MAGRCRSPAEHQLWASFRQKLVYSQRFAAFGWIATGPNTSNAKNHDCRSNESQSEKVPWIGSRGFAGAEAGSLIKTNVT